jgi:hypothetical protein
MRGDTLELQRRIRDLPLQQSLEHIQETGQQGKVPGQIPTPVEISTMPGADSVAVVTSDEPLPSTSAPTNPVPAVGVSTAVSPTDGFLYPEHHQRAMQAVKTAFPEWLPQDPNTEKLLSYVAAYMAAWTELRGPSILFTAKLRHVHQWPA